jgi:hypothetical protein
MKREVVADLRGGPRAKGVMRVAMVSCAYAQIHAKWASDVARGH